MKILNNQLLKYLIVVVPLILAIIFLILYINTINDYNQLRTNYDKSLSDYKEKVKGLIVQNHNLNVLRKNSPPNTINLYDWDIKRLKEKGLSDPVREIIDDLIKHSELIPYKGILGGTMEFYDREIWILNNKWVFAYFEDGHVMGYLLLEYSISDDGKIEWKRIASMRS
ncbi:MAG: hypothetical protein A2057_09215 [Ignavibacteria bacterium GWA2_35_9]|nr:MAG: hypothetical protein A2057_09215 [Ignavibacteria bacterium GWA2_35_9]OGU48701.1 MAG: hypothetical protein A2000_05150 [Ignavibacteria bacterium GWB2_36_8]OGU49666.1 MAG: hypothetical protein A2080_06230 [Ignavibacteria bacterium GWC2_36_12]